METLSKEAERKLLDCIRTVNGEVSDGCSPTEAVTKVAQDAQLSPHFVRLVCNAYNTGCTTRQREEHEDVLGKMADFALADADSVLESLYPAGGEKKASWQPVESDDVSAVYSKPPTKQINKEALARPLPRITIAPYAKDTTSSVRQKLAAADVARRELENAQLNVLRLERELLNTLGETSDYFKQSSSQRESFRTVERNVEVLFDKVGSDVMQYVRDRNKMKAKDYDLEKPAGYGKVNIDHRPYSWITEIVQLGQDLIVAREKLARLKPAPEVAGDERPFPATTSLSAFNLLGDGLPKQALVNETVGSLLGAGLTGIADNATKPNKKLEENTWLDLEDPQHLNEMRKAETQAMLTDLLANDDVISGYDPHEVLKHYNEIVKLHPSAADKAVLMRPQLRKSLAGSGLEPFETGEMAKTEQLINQTKNKTPKSLGLLDAPESILG